MTKLRISNPIAGDTIRALSTLLTLKIPPNLNAAKGTIVLDLLVIIYLLSIPAIRKESELVREYIYPV